MAEYPAMQQQLLTIGVDTGGTFTDLVLDDGGSQLLTYKLLSTPEDPARAVLQGVQALLRQWMQAAAVTDYDPRQVLVIHGSTVATNALLEGRGARTALITTAGFEDLLWIGRQNRPQLYALEPHKPAPPIEREAVIGVTERILFDGSVLTPLTQQEIRAAVWRLQQLNCPAAVICLLHSYANPLHEQQLAAAIRSALPQVHLTVSHELLPEMREYERAATCVANAVVAPVMSGYLSRLEHAVEPQRVRVMSSAGGNLPVANVCREPVHTVLSGPAGGVLGALAAAGLAGISRIITFDMGGTSTDVALADGQPQISTENVIAGLPLRLPMLDIHTVGAGGGSRIWIDSGGALRVGPASLGADPGPACYGRQDQPYRAAVTDAHVVLGHLQPDLQLAGCQPLNAEAAHTAIAAFAGELGLSVEQAALGALRVAEVTMARAVQRISLERGFDPREFVLVPFGGAGGLHAARLAELLGIREILIPGDCGLLSAFGMALSGPLYTFSQALMLTLQPHFETTTLIEHPRIAAVYDLLYRQAQAALEQDKASLASRYIKASIDLRYAGQSYEINIPLESEHVIEEFAQQHQRLYGYRRSDHPVEAVTLRMRAGCLPKAPQSVKVAEAQRPALDIPCRYIVINDGVDEVKCKQYSRHQLLSGDRVLGPAVVTEYSATTLVPAGWSCTVNPYHQLQLQQQTLREASHA